MIFALLMVLQTPAAIADWDGLPIPDAVGRPAASYIGCLSDPLEQTMTSGQPVDPNERNAMLGEVLAGCRDSRVRVAAEMDVKLASMPGWTDPAVRRLKIERMLAAAEERVGFAVVDREDFLKLANEVLQCTRSGRPDCEKQLLPHGSR